MTTSEKCLRDIEELVNRSETTVAMLCSDYRCEIIDIVGDRCLETGVSFDDVRYQILQYIVGLLAYRRTADAVSAQYNGGPECYERHRYSFCRMGRKTVQYADALLRGGVPRIAARVYLYLVRMAD